MWISDSVSPFWEWSVILVIDWVWKAVSDVLNNTLLAPNGNITNAIVRMILWNFWSHVNQVYISLEYKNCILFVYYILAYPLGLLYFTESSLKQHYIRNIFIFEMLFDPYRKNTKVFTRGTVFTDGIWYM